MTHGSAGRGWRHGLVVRDRQRLLALDHALSLLTVVPTGLQFVRGVCPATCMAGYRSIPPSGERLTSAVLSTPLNALKSCYRNGNRTQLRWPLTLPCVAE